MTLADELAVQERAWRERPLVRRLYRDWFRQIAARLAPQGPTVELGAGIAKLKEVVPDVIATDVERTPWSDEAVDAQALPYGDSSVGNLVLVDVFHHLPDPARFFEEAARVLMPGGRVVVLDPYCSLVSTLAYRLFHHERTDLSAPAFDPDPRLAFDPMESNQARATLVFFRHADELLGRWPELRLVERCRLSYLVYALSGGFTKQPILPRPLWSAAFALERSLRLFAPLLAFRCLVVLERQPGESRGAAGGGDVGSGRSTPGPEISR